MHTNTNSSSNTNFTTAFENLTHNRISSSDTAKKEGTIYYLDNPTLSTSLCNKSFINLFENITNDELFNMLASVYTDIDETTPSETLRAAAINKYFGLTSSKTGYEAEFNASSKLSRVDFMAMFARATISPTESQKDSSETDIMGLVSEKSYLGTNEKNNTESGIMTKAEAFNTLETLLSITTISDMRKNQYTEAINSAKSLDEVAQAKAKIEQYISDVQKLSNLTFESGTTSVRGEVISTTIGGLISSSSDTPTDTGQNTSDGDLDNIVLPDGWQDVIWR